MYCAHCCTHLYRTVTASCSVCISLSYPLVGRNLLPRLGVQGGAIRRQNLTRTRLHLASWSVMRNAGCHRHIAGQTCLTRGARSSGCMLIFAAACIYLGAGIDRSCVNKCFCISLEVSVVYVYKKLRSVTVVKHPPRFCACEYLMHMAVVQTHHHATARTYVLGRTHS